MVAVPILAQFMPLSVAVPLVVLFDLACTALVGGRNWRQVSRVELARLFPWMLLGIFLGVTLLRRRALAADRAGLLRADGLRRAA